MTNCSYDKILNTLLVDLGTKIAHWRHVGIVTLKANNGIQIVWNGSPIPHLYVLFSYKLLQFVLDYEKWSIDIQVKAAYMIADN